MSLVFKDTHDVLQMCHTTFKLEKAKTNVSFIYILDKHVTINLNNFEQILACNAGCKEQFSFQMTPADGNYLFS